MENLPSLPDDPRNKVHALIQQALQSNANIEALERLFAMMKDAQATYAEQQFYIARSQFQAECPIIYKTMQGAKSRYAPLDEIIAKIQPLLGKYGFSFDIDVDHSHIGNGLLIIICTVSHVDGYQKKVSVPTAVLPGNKATNYTHDVAGTITYGKRYAIANAFGIVTTDPDTDAHVDVPALLARLGELMKQVERGEQLIEALLEKRGVQHTSDLPPRVIASVIKQLEARLAKQQEQEKGSE